MDTKRQAVALGVHSIDHLVDILRGEGGHMKHRAEDFLFHFLDAANLEHCRRHKPALLRHRHFLQQLALLLKFIAMIGNFLAGVLVDHRAHVCRQQPRVANAQLFHSTVEHFQQVLGDVFLHVEHTQGGTALAGTLE